VSPQWKTDRPDLTARITNEFHNDWLTSRNERADQCCDVRRAHSKPTHHRRQAGHAERDAAVGLQRDLVPPVELDDAGDAALEEAATEPERHDPLRRVAEPIDDVVVEVVKVRV